VVAAINLLVDAHGGRRVPQDVVDAFHAWRMDEYTTHRRQIDAQPERYGVVDWDNDPVFRQPAEVRGARYRVRWEKPGPDCWKHGCVGLGWELNPTNAQDRLHVEQGLRTAGRHDMGSGGKLTVSSMASIHGWCRSPERPAFWRGGVPLNRPDRPASVRQPRGAEP